MTVCLIRGIIHATVFIVSIDIHFDFTILYMFESIHSRLDVHTQASKQASSDKKMESGFPYYKVTTAVCLIFKDNNPISHGDVLIG